LKDFAVPNAFAIEKMPKKNERNFPTGENEQSDLNEK
jgi:hypothetical protein